MLIGRLSGCLKTVYGTTAVTIHKKGKNLARIGIGTDERGNSLDPEKEYGLLVEPQLMKIKHRLNILILVENASDLQELYDSITIYHREYAKPGVEFKYPAQLLPQ